MNDETEVMLETENLSGKRYNHEWLAKRAKQNEIVIENRKKFAGKSKVQIWNEDCIQGMADHIPDESVDCAVSSIPFGALFMYSGKTSDIGNNQDGIELHAGQFGLHMRFFFDQLYRIMKPGAVFACHIQQLDTTKVQHGYMGIRDFRGSVITLGKNHGFNPHGEFIIPKNPQAVAQRRKKHSLMFVTGKRDSRMLAPTANDYVVLFRKPGDGLAIKGLFDKDENPDGWFSQEDWIKWASGIWDDILEIDVLEGYRTGKESDEEKHVCPLQLEVIRRCILLYSAPGQMVFDPFMGIGSTAYVAVELGRDAMGFELKESYFKLALKNVEKAYKKAESENVSLFK